MRFKYEYEIITSKELDHMDKDDIREYVTYLSDHLDRISVDVNFCKCYYLDFFSNCD